MMISQTSLTLTLLFGVLGGCSDIGPIDFTVTGGLTGKGDGTALHVALDGTATRRLQDGSTETAVLDDAILDDLHGKILDARFPSLAPLYGGTCCDVFIYQVSVQLNGDTHSVGVSQRAQPPVRLGAVVDTLRRIYSLPLDWH